MTSANNNTLYRIVARGPYASAVSPYVALKVLGAPVIAAQNGAVTTDAWGWFRIGVAAERAVAHRWQVEDPATGIWSWTDVTSPALEDYAWQATRYRVLVSTRPARCCPGPSRSPRPPQPGRPCGPDGSMSR